MNEFNNGDRIIQCYKSYRGYKFLANTPKTGTFIRKIKHRGILTDSKYFPQLCVVLFDGNKKTSSIPIEDIRALEDGGE